MNIENNSALRKLLSLPPVKKSAATSVAVVEMPQETVVTGDREVDAVLWLQAVVDTGHQAYIDKAIEAIKLIKTPMKALEDRYAAYIQKGGGGIFTVMFGISGFGELEARGKAAVKKAARKADALARFGSVDAIFKDTRAEKACKKALRGLNINALDDDKCAARFSNVAELVPLTIDDCLYARRYWRRLYDLRMAAGDFGDSLPEAFAHECYCFGMLAHIQPRGDDEAIGAFEHMLTDDGLDAREAPSVLRNLVMSGWASADEFERALRGLSNMYGSTWDRVGGGLMMMDSGLQRFEAAHKEARRVLGVELMEADENGELYAEHQTTEASAAENAVADGPEVSACNAVELVAAEEPNVDTVPATVVIPAEPTEALLSPFYDCPPEELGLAWQAMVMIAKSTLAQTGDSTTNQKS